MSDEDWPLLCFLFLDPENRLVHSHACQPDETGWVTFPDSVFIRQRKPGGFGQVGERLFRRVHKRGWLKRVNIIDYGGKIGPQDEYQLSDAAIHRFKNDTAWQRELFRWQQVVNSVRRERAAA